MFTRPPVTLVCFGVLLAGCAHGTPQPESDQTPDLPPDQVEIPYGAQEAEDITGAVSAIPLDENEHVHDVVEMLQSHVPGLQVRYLSNGDIRLRIRGDQQTLRTDDEFNQPLLVIDGMPILPTAVRGALRGIIPHEVESIQVLKDISSTAIYGTRGANGVIIIRMKR